MKKYPIISLVCLLIFAQAVFSQDISVKNTENPSENAKDQNKLSPELQQKAIEFLRETETDVNGLRTLENRISFSAEMAGLMWFSDEEEARKMFQNVIGNFRQLLAQYDAQLNAYGIKEDDVDLSPFGSSAKAKVTRKFVKALSVRQQITMSLSEHDPRLALDFFTETAQAISNPAFRKQIEERDRYFEMRLLNEIAEQDVETALKYGRNSLSKGVNYMTIELLKKIYEKDADKGVDFGKDIVSKLKSDGAGVEAVYIYSALLSFGEESIKETKNGKDKAVVFSDQSMRDIADAMARYILSKDAEDGSDFAGYIPVIEKYAPSRAVQLRAKFSVKENSSAAKGGTASGKGIAITEVPPPPPGVYKDGDGMVEGGESAEEQIMKEVANLGDKKLSQEERRETIGKARQIIAGIDEREKKLAALSGLAMQIAQLGDKELASEVLDEAGRLINFQPVSYQDYLEVWMLISTYSNVNPEKGFPLLENTIYRLNDTIGAFIKVAEFIDINGEIIEDGEIQLGNFGGGMTRDLLRGLGSADTVVRNLSVADFDRMKAITNRFDRSEVRVLAKMLVLRAVLGSLKEKTETEKSVAEDAVEVLESN